MEEIAAVIVIRDRVTIEDTLAAKVLRAQAEDLDAIEVTRDEWNYLVERMTTPRTVDAMGEGPYALSIGGRPVRVEPDTDSPPTC